MIDWLIRYSDRGQVSKTSNGQFSLMHPITRSIIQGSGIGPTLWLVMASDLCCISDINLLFKYADDTNLLVLENTDVDLAVEFRNIQRWADSNGMVTLGLPQDQGNSSAQTSSSTMILT